MGRIGLVLGAGGVVGHGYHAGVLAALADVTGWDPGDAEVIVGTSAGASVAAYLRGGIAARDLAARALGQPVSDEARRRLAQVPPMELPDGRLGRGGLPRPASPLYLARSALAPWRSRVGTMLAAALPEGLLPTTAIGRSVRPLFCDGWPRRDLWLCAVSLRDGRLVAFGKEAAPRTDVGTAVEASCAIPGFFAPVTIAGVRYIDGGAHSPTNLDLLAGEGLDLVIVSSPLTAVRGVPRRGLQAQARVLHSYRLARERRQVRADGTEVMIFEPTADDVVAMGPNAMDGTRRAAAVRQAYETTRQRLSSRSGRDRERIGALKDLKK